MAQIFITVIIQGLISVYFLLQKERKKYALINLYMMVVCTDFLAELFVYRSLQENAAYLDLMPSSFRLLKGPLLFMLARQVTGRPLKLKVAVCLLIPFLALFGYNVLLLAAVGLKSAQLDQLIQGYNPFFIYYPYYWMIYLMVALYTLNAFTGEESSMLKGVRMLVSYLMVTVMLYYFAHKAGMDGEWLRKTYTYLFLLQFALVLHIRFNKDRAKVAMSFVPDQKPAYKNSVLNDQDIARLVEQIRSALQSGKLYLNEEVSLDDLARYIKAPRHHVTVAIAKGLQTSFYDLVNSYRLEEVLRLMNAEEQEPLTDLYFRCGFKSKTTFYKYFKQKTGLSPAEYRSRLNQLPSRDVVR